jgi:hypothetical protein
MGLLSNAKDRLVERAALAYLNAKWLAPYGRATSLRIDSTAKSIRVEAELNGEKSPLKIEATEYAIARIGDRFHVTVKRIRTSREWLTALAQNHLCNVPFELPAELGGLLSRAL